MPKFYWKQFKATQDELFIDEVCPPCVDIDYKPSKEKIDIYSQKFNIDNIINNLRKTLLSINIQDNYITIFPLNTLPSHPDFLKEKYNRIKSITLEGFDYNLPETIEDIEAILEDMPSGFIKDYEYGLGLLKDYRFIIEAIEELPEIEHLCICKEASTRISGNIYHLNFNDYNSIRKGINRISENHQENARIDKSIFSYNSLINHLDSAKFPEKKRPYKKDTIFKYISNLEIQNSSLSESDHKAVVNIISNNKKEIFEKNKPDMLQLKEKIEIANLEWIINKYENLLSINASERKWQQLFNSNPFIISLTFGYPVIKIQDQASVGGKNLSGRGDKITDFLMKNYLTNNVAIVEIKRADTPLLQQKEYRGGVYGPSHDLTGSINQILDQNYKFQKEITIRKENSGIYDFESYAVDCVLIIGTTPMEKEQKKSFELFRGNSKEVRIFTFDELLKKLKDIYSFLSSDKF
ncbi:MAG: Shedu immune nuclease family protein [Desulfococcaceae bacterium]